MGFDVYPIEAGREVGQPALIHHAGILGKIVNWAILSDRLRGITAQGMRKIHVLSTQEQPIACLWERQT